MSNLKASWSSSSPRTVEFHELPNFVFFRCSDDTSHRIYYKMPDTYMYRAGMSCGMPSNTLNIAPFSTAFYTEPHRACVQVVQVQEVRFTDLQIEEEERENG